MAKHAFTKSDVDLICSYLRVGADIETALSAITDLDGNPWPQSKRDDFAKRYAKEIESAQAQCRVLCLHNIMTEGGVSSSQFILKRIEREAGGESDSGDLSFL